MSVDIFWIPYNGNGRMGIATRPRGGDWLEDDINYLHNAGTDLLVSMLTPDESRELKLDMEEKLCQEAGMNYQSVPIQDRGAPPTIGKIAALALQWEKCLDNGSNIIFHCRQGVGRSAMMAAAVLVTSGMEADFAFRIIEKARGCPVPDTEEQRAWVEQYAAGLQIMDGLKVAEKMKPYKKVRYAHEARVEPA